MTAELFIVIVILLIFAVIVFLIRRNALKSAGLLGKVNLTPVAGDGWSAEMGWRYVSYIENNTLLVLGIEPMAKDKDTVNVPDEKAWLENAPEWARNRRVEILDRLKSVLWNRKLEWQEGKSPFNTYGVIQGSLESTSGGKMLEKRRLFHPGSKITHEEAHELWHDAARMFAQAAKGNVTIFAPEIILGSVFQEVELPVLEINSNVTLDFKNQE